MSNEMPSGPAKVIFTLSKQWHTRKFADKMNSLLGRVSLTNNPRNLADDLSSRLEASYGMDQTSSRQSADGKAASFNEVLNSMTRAVIEVGDQSISDRTNPFKESHQENIKALQDALIETLETWHKMPAEVQAQIDKAGVPVVGITVTPDSLDRAFRNISGKKSVYTFIADLAPSTPSKPSFTRN